MPGRPLCAGWGLGAIRAVELGLTMPMRPASVTPSTPITPARRRASHMSTCKRALGGGGYTWTQSSKSNKEWLGR